MLPVTHEAAATDENERDAALELALDAALGDSFPASDPVAFARRRPAEGAAPV